MLQYHGRADSDSLSKLDTILERVLQLNPRFAPALIVRSQIYVRQGKLQEAYNVAVEAQRLEPDRAGYLTNTAAILLQGRNYAKAVEVGSSVAARWPATDAAEALAVVAQARQIGNIVRTADEEAREKEDMNYAAETTAVDGIVKAINCEKSKPLELVLQVGENELKFRAGKTFGYGFSDTLWFGADHFSPCYHLEGMKAVARYGASSQPNAENELRWLEIRDQLILASLAGSTD
jgi:tetratricopeptide (TPR) repeat protein